MGVFRSITDLLKVIMSGAHTFLESGFHYGMGGEVRPEDIDTGSLYTDFFKLVKDETMDADRKLSAAKESLTDSPKDRIVKDVISAFQKGNQTIRENLEGYVEKVRLGGEAGQSALEELTNKVESVIFAELIELRTQDRDKKSPREIIADLSDPDVMKKITEILGDAYLGKESKIASRLGDEVLAKVKTQLIENGLNHSRTQAAINNNNLLRERNAAMGLGADEASYPDDPGSQSNESQNNAYTP